MYMNMYTESLVRPDIVLLIDLRESFFRLRVGGGVKKKKNSENDQLTGHFQSFFCNISRQTGKLVK